jgi:hypothetical protein
MSAVPRKRISACRTPGMYRASFRISVNIANLLKTRERKTAGVSGDDAATVAAMDGKVG